MNYTIKYQTIDRNYRTVIVTAKTALDAKALLLKRDTVQKIVSVL